MGFEANTCRIRITPKLKADGWDSAPLSHSTQRSFTAGLFVVNTIGLMPKLLACLAIADPRRGEELNDVLAA